MHRLYYTSILRCSFCHSTNPVAARVRFCLDTRRLARHLLGSLEPRRGSGRVSALGRTPDCARRETDIVRPL